MSGFVQRYQNHLALHAIVLIWGFTGILGKVISIPYYSIVIYRMGIAFLGLLVFFFVAQRPFSRNRSTIIKCIAIGMIVAAHWATFFQALKVANVSVVLTTLASASLFVAFLEPLFFKRRIIMYEVGFGFLVILGLYLIYNFETQYMLGIVLALVSAFLAALFSTLNAIMVRTSTPGQITLLEMFGGVLGMSLYTLFFEDVTIGAFSPSQVDWIYLLILGLICTALAFVVSVRVMRELSPFTVSISINMEPIYAIILALIFFGEEEKMTPGFYLGAGIILSTVIANGILKRKLKSLKSN